MPESQRDRLSGLRVLVVEDELLVAMELEDALQNMGCIVVGPAPTVPRALALLDGHAPDIALLDVNLGSERSTPVAEALLVRGTPFLLTSGYERAQLPDRAFRNAPLLGKPLRFADLERLMLEVLKTTPSRRLREQP